MKLGLSQEPRQNLRDGSFSCAVVGLLSRLWVGVFGIGKKVVAVSGTERKRHNATQFWSNEFLQMKRPRDVVDLFAVLQL